MNNNIVVLKNVQKSFGETPVFDDVSFAIGHDEFISICGSSGSGKTTLVNVLGLLEHPTNGQIFWQGREVTATNIAKISKIRSNIFGYIFQQCNLVPELNVLENVLFPKKISGKVSSSDKEFARQLLSHVSLDGYDTRNISTLSGGERQRVAVIRAMINLPSIVVADEPTGSLDEKSANVVMDMIIDLCKRQHSSLLLITHNQAFANRMNQMYLLSNARLEKIK